MGDCGRPGLPLAVEAGDDALTLEERALEWIEPYWNAEHLRRTRDWLLELDPDASEALRLAALTHDIERHFPGGPANDLSVAPEDDMEYRRAHSERSAGFVTAWLREQGAGERLVAPTAFLSRGGSRGLRFVAEHEGELRLGALATHRAVELSPLVREKWPALARAFSLVASPRVRNRATVGGVLGDADYASDPPSMFVALGARVVVQSRHGARE